MNRKVSLEFYSKYFRLFVFETQENHRKGLVKLMATKQIPFRPKLEGDFKNRFYKVVSTISSETPSNEIIRLAEEEITWAEECYYNLEQRVKYRAIWFLLKDLINARYKAEYKNGALYMDMPTLTKQDLQSNSISEIKNLMRSWMSESRHERIVDGKEFVLRMEKTSTTRRSVAELIADGNELVDRLERALNGELELSEVIDPRLELVEEDSRDEGFTNQKLSDIWQYFRLTWSSAYENTPGRTIRYLIRDYAHPMHAVMGIASLENCTVQITTRDDYLGWTLSGFVKRIEPLSEKEKRAEFSVLLNYIEEGIRSIDWTDICDPSIIDHPAQEDINKIALIAKESEEKRKSLLLNANDSIVDEEKSELGNISKDTETVLFLKKRADQLAKYLSAKKVIRDFLEYGDVDEKSIEFCNSDNGSSAVYTALIAQKTKHIGSSMIELNVCGAIPPYNHLLGGKLVALLALSPQVIHDYRKKYQDKISEIASRMKGESVTRPADLVYIGTTSLYYVGSSQYNRLKIPGDIYGQSYDVTLKELGYTVGFGTMHISRTTTMALNEAVGDDSHLINHVFGEGASPKFRLLTMSVSKLLESSLDCDPKEFTKHAMPRIVYGACLAKNTQGYLLGYDDKPDYYTDIDEYEIGTQKIIDYWRSRWLSSRLKHAPIFEKIRNFDKTELLISNEFVENESYEFKKLEEVSPMPQTTKKEKLNFVRGFYRGTSAFADNIPIDLLTLIHVETDLDKVIVDDVSSGKDVILTGNAGDGKTHIIKVHKDKLEETGKNPVFMLDASEKSSAEIYDRWREARREGRPFVLAINAAILFQLYEYCQQNDQNFKPPFEAFDLMQNSVTFHGNGVEYEDVALYDLNQRNILDSAFVKKAIAKLSDDSLFEECSSCMFNDVCPAHRNRKHINNILFVERLCFILNRVSLQGYHATLRDLQSLISFLIFADKSCKELSMSAGGDGNDITDLLYDSSAEGEIFSKIQKCFDPVTISHPIYDEHILKNDIDSSSWDPEFDAPFGSIIPTDLNSFNHRKRQFFFFNTEGSKYIEVNDDLVAQFDRFLNDADDRSVRKQIVKKLDRFFETEPSNDLVIWTGHRFDNQPRKILLSIGSIPDNKFSIGRPQLQTNMQRGFNLARNYIRFEKKVSPNENIFLKIDYGMFELLTQAENGVPLLFMESDVVKKVWRFVEQLQSIKDYSSSERIDFSILDVQTRERVNVTMDQEEKQYMKLQIEHRRNQG